jgi:hypothetical protein
MKKLAFYILISLTALGAAAQVSITQLPVLPKDSVSVQDIVLGVHIKSDSTYQITLGAIDSLFNTLNGTPVFNSGLTVDTPFKASNIFTGQKVYNTGVLMAVDSFGFVHNAGQLGQLASISQPDTFTATPVFNSGLTATAATITNATTDTLLMGGLHPAASDTLLGYDSQGGLGASHCMCVKHVRDSISTTQIKSSAATFVQVLPAPGAGLYYHILAANESYVWKDSTYLNSGDCVLSYANANNIGYIDADILATGSSVNSYFVPFIPGTYNSPGSYGSTVSSPLANAALYFGTVGSPPTQGHGYIILRIDYTIEQY